MTMPDLRFVTDGREYLACAYVWVFLVPDRTKGGRGVVQRRDGFLHIAPVAPVESAADTWVLP